MTYGRHNWQGIEPHWDMSSDVAQLGNVLGWTLQDAAREGLDVSAVRVCRGCGRLFVIHHHAQKYCDGVCAHD